MKLPFTAREFFDVFKSYNQDLYPLQVLFYVLAFSIIIIAVKRPIRGGRIISLILSVFWFWMGIVYHLLYFSVINRAAFLFGGLFILQGVIFLYLGFIRNRLEFKFNPGRQGYSGTTLILYALVIYPLLSYLNGHILPSAPTFGLPCPTTIFTLGILCWTERKPPAVLWSIPVLWSFIGFIAALALGVTEDTGLFAAGVIMVILLSGKQWNKHLTAGSHSR